ncbi:hypothetical protein HPP92_013675 [Vanilla planifolia]|uniref:Protein kinase domain-containing protein n=1 Tax=Vanilla planifolia TaxID=51239 RepID=A0A835QSR9_VANPL|nr:hypothetical protein HPP92_013675 [Vanilla planifolia]
MGCFKCFCCCKPPKDSELTRRGEKKSWFCYKKREDWGFGRKGCCFHGKDLSKVNPESGGGEKRRGCFSCFGSSKDSANKRKGRILCCCSRCKGKSSMEDSAKENLGETRCCLSFCNGNSSKEDSVKKGGSGTCCCLDCSNPKSSEVDSSKKTDQGNWCCFGCCNGRSSKEDSTMKGKGGTCFCLGCKPKSSKDDSSKKTNGKSCCLGCYNGKSSKEDSTKNKKQRTSYCLCCNSKSSQEVSTKKANGTCWFCFDCCHGQSSKKNSTKKEKRGTCHFLGCCNPNSTMEDSSKTAIGKNCYCFCCCRDKSSKDASTKKAKGETLCCFPKSSKGDSAKKAKGRNWCCFGYCNGKSSKEDTLTKHGDDLCCHGDFKTSKDESSKKLRKRVWCFFCCCVEDSKEDALKKKQGCILFCCGKNSKQPGHEEARTVKKNSESTSKKRSRVMGYSGLCCSSSSDERRPTPRTRYYLSCFCCIQSYKKRRKVSSICLQSEEQPDGGIHLASLGQNKPLQSVSDDKHESPEEDALQLGNTNAAVQVFAYEELAAATNNFSIDCLLNSDGYGRVYKGFLSETNEVVIVKKLDMKGNQGFGDFITEVIMLSLLHHPNLVKLFGYCVQERILVYEYMPFGSLQQYLHDVTPNIKPLDWFTRMKIAAGAAKGLEYLHEMANPPVIYRDMKASNILLDENYNPKLSDFGLAKLGSAGEKAHVSTRVMGTYGYCAPEYALGGQLSKSSDVYSYGVLLLELITGRKAIDYTRPKGEQLLAQWAAPLLRNKRRFATMVDPRLNGSIPMKGLYHAIAIADMCLHHEASTRPLIRDVVAAVEHLAKPDPECCATDDLNEPIFLEQLTPSNHERMGMANMSFEEETFQSLSSDAESSCNLREIE